MTIKNFFLGRTIVFIALLLILGLVASYFALRKRTVDVVVVPPNGHVAENPEGEADPSRMTLGMNTWTWISASYNDGLELKPGVGQKFTLALAADGIFSAKTDCNSLSGKYVAHDGAISFSQIASTKMFCDVPGGSQEAAYTKLLQNAQIYHFTNRGELIFDLMYDSGVVVFR